jgi:hypothetical protein
LRLLRAVPGAWLVLSSAACSLLISGQDEPLTCSQEAQKGPPACDEGFTCHHGICALQQQEEVEAGGEGGTPWSGAPGLGDTAGAGGAKGNNGGQGGASDS